KSARHSAWGGGPLPSKAVTDALLDELREGTGRATTRHGKFVKSRCSKPCRRLGSRGPARNGVYGLYTRFHPWLVRVTTIQPSARSSPGSASYHSPVDCDIAVIGAGPAGSLAGYHLATAGARVLLVDKAEFPRDKPCGGGVTGRAAKLLPFSIEPVVEHVVARRRGRLRYRGNGFERRAPGPLVYMTQRKWLHA